MSGSVLYSGDHAEMLSELQHCCVAARECSGISSESKAGLSIGTSMALASECGNVRAKGMYVHLCKSLFNMRHEAS